ncbi:MAG: OmpA family protein [Crocinitomicaceae bacterium]|nr:OmpA family protein [Crocinitomicaceae bacterium]
MIRTIFIFILGLTLYFSAFSQVEKAPLKVIVMNKERKAIPNDKITFIGEKSHIEITGITNEMGQFMVHLPAGDNYGIRVDVIGDEIDYNTFEVPTPPPGSVFNTVTLEIVYDMEQSITLDDLHFSSGSSSISKQSYALLNQLAEYLIRKKTTKIRIEGHTDSDGNETSNQQLSEDRAKAIQSYLIKKGVNSSNLTAKGFGESQPIASNETTEGKAENRRTVIVVL